MFLEMTKNHLTMGESAARVPEFILAGPSVADVERHDTGGIKAQAGRFHLESIWLGYSYAFLYWQGGF